MGVELRIRWDDRTWLGSHRAQVEQMIRELPSFAKQEGDEFWLKDTTTPSTWAFDVRVFLETETIFFEVSGKTRSFREDVRRLHTLLAAASTVRLEDCDDPDESVDINRLFR